MADTSYYPENLRDQRTSNKDSVDLERLRYWSMEPLVDYLFNPNCGCKGVVQQEGQTR